MARTLVEVRDILNKDSLVLHSDGLRLFDSLEKAAKDDVDSVELSFKGITLATTAFLNASIGKYLSSDLRIDLVIKNVEEDIVRDKIKLVQENTASKETRLKHDIRSTGYLDGDH